MGLIARLWKNFKVQPEIWFFSGFLLTFTLTIRKVLWFLPLRGELNEYSGTYLYLSDIFLGLTIVAWIVSILYNKIDILSMLKDVPLQKGCSTPNLPIVPRGTIIYILLPLALVIWSFISLVWAENKIVAIFRSIKILEFYLLYIFVLVRLFYWNINNNVPSQKECSTWNILRDKRGTLLKKIFSLIMIIGLFQAIIGIMQFILQHSIGLFWLKESLISPNIAGVAKIIFNGETFIRTYGLFPHPNILGGFLLFSILIALLYYKMFHVEQYGQNKNVPRGTLIKIFLGIQLLALILTFSKSAILGLILGLVYIAHVSSRKECSTWNIPLDECSAFMNFLRKKKRLIITVSLIIIFSFVIAKPNLYSFLFKSLNERSVYTNVSRGTIWNNPILGIGSGQFVISMENLSVIKENWMLQPVHNVFMLVWSELGVIGLLILLVFILCILLRNVPRLSRVLKLFHVEQFQNLGNSVLINVKNTFGAIFIGFLFIMFFDHYLWDIQQGSFLLWMTLGFLVGAGECKDTI